MVPTGFHQMTDSEAIEQVLAALGGEQGHWTTIRKNGRLLLVLPAGRKAACRTLHLYQPQRMKAKVTMVIVQCAAKIGLHRNLLPQITCHGGKTFLNPAFPEVRPGSVGLMLGSPEHHVRRAIASFRTASGWEVAKVAFGAGGWEVIRGEVEALNSLPAKTPGAPTLLGVHRGEGISLMRMPFFQGSVLKHGDSADAVALLASWRSESSPKPISGFSEWTVIKAALSGSEQGHDVLERLSRLWLQPVVRHGDFARWNLLRTVGNGLMVLDWEWGIADGMPGIDLVHFFAQDARLVLRLSPPEVVQSVMKSLGSAECIEYLNATGWSGDIASAMVASIAFTVGAKQQANEQILAALLDTWPAMARP
jgi:hypothetical protein